MGDNSSRNGSSAGANTQLTHSAWWSLAATGPQGPGPERTKALNRQRWWRPNLLRCFVDFVAGYSSFDGASIDLADRIFFPGQLWFIEKKRMP